MCTKLIIFFTLSIIYIPVIFSQSAWVNQTSGVTTNLAGVFFNNSNTGWASAYDGTIIKTTNGGTNWTIQNSTTTLPLYNIMFADANTGWAAGGFNDQNPLCSHNVIVIKTTNGGNSWTQQISGSGYLFNDLYVLNNQRAYVTNSGSCCPPFCIMESGSLSSTSNSGQNWLYPFNKASHSVFFLNEDTGWVSARTSSDIPPRVNYIYRTTDAGNIWELMYADSTNYTSFKKIFFIDELTGYAQRGSLLKSTNSGVTWFTTDSIITDGTSDNFFINNDTGWCSGGSGKIIRTNNGGLNWTYQTTGTANHLSSVHFIDAYTGWAVGNNGTVIKTITGGLTSVIQTQIIVNSFLLEQNFPNPFNPFTVIRYSLIENRFVTLKLYDVRGNEIATLVNEKQNVGNYDYQFSTVNYKLSSGVYFYRLEAGKFVETKRMILLR